MMWQNDLRQVPCPMVLFHRKHMRHWRCYRTTFMENPIQVRRRCIEVTKNWIPQELADDRCSAIKQVASGRFGVTSRYLVSAREIQIRWHKCKTWVKVDIFPYKASPWIAKPMHSTPGCQPPDFPATAHDIYSIIRDPGTVNL